MKAAQGARSSRRRKRAVNGAALDSSLKRRTSKHLMRTAAANSSPDPPDPGEAAVGEAEHGQDNSGAPRSGGLGGPYTRLEIEGG